MMEEKNIKKPKGILKLIKAAGYSLEGLQSAIATEEAFRLELILLVIGTILAFFLDIAAIERALMIASLMLILIVEIVNTAFEVTIERISSDRHALSKRAKDLGSAAVFLAVLNALMVWAIILLG
ncbi:MAG: diacylglycerol kinase [Alphaproteobacteria bacterium]